MIYGVFSMWCIDCKHGFTMSPILISKTNCKTSAKSVVRRSILLTGASLILIAGASTSCNTTRGFGQDVEKTGDEIQEAATR
jgi:predicted small secreted protein